MAITKYYKFITPQSADADITDNQPTVGNGLYGNYTWYHRLVQGSPTRITRYREYDLMDADNDVAIALDMIAEEMTGNASKMATPLNAVFDDALQKNIRPSVVSTVNAALKTWCAINEWEKRMFPLARACIKYGDVFFRRNKHKNKKLEFIHCKNITGAVVKEIDVTDITAWHVKLDSKYLNSHNSGTAGFSGISNDIGEQVIPADEIVRFSLHDEMSEDAPFGKSILACVYRAFKHKELLEDALIIYRIQRAPEKRVFYINTGKMHPQKVAQHLEQIKNEIKQKKIPTSYGGKHTVESVYNPQSMSEDFFFSIGPNGEGSRVETLPGGQSLGELADLDYFYAKLWRGLRIPQSYIASNSEGMPSSDGKVGIAYLQEIKFTLYVERLQKFLEDIFDIEFKRFMEDNNLHVDHSLFKVRLPEPSNFAKSRQQQMDSDLLNTYSTTSGMKELSRRFALKTYLQLSESQIIENERMLREEAGLPIDGDNRDLPKLYNPDAAEAGGFEGGLGGMGSSGGGGGGSSSSSGLDTPDAEFDENDMGDEGDADQDTTDADIGDEGDGSLAPDKEAPQKSNNKKDLNK